MKIKFSPKFTNLQYHTVLHFLICEFYDHLQIYDLAKETVVLLLDFNADTQGLLDWVIDRCYTGANEVADGCFHALAAVFQTR